MATKNKCQQKQMSTKNSQLNPTQPNITQLNPTKHNPTQLNPTVITLAIFFILSSPGVRTFSDPFTVTSGFLSTELT